MPLLPRGWLNREERALVPPRRLWVGPLDSISHYYRWVWEYLAYLTLVADLRREHSVLELGCGHGRTGRGLLAYLRSPGRYVGLDLDARRIQDARAWIQRRFPNFEFIHADVRHPYANPAGPTEARDYTFPFADASFDVIYAASLFSHLLPDAARRYLQESRRVLKPGGRCLFSFFLLDHYRGPGTTISPLYEFRDELPGTPGVAVHDRGYPDALVGYRLEILRAFSDRAGLRVARVIPGLWSESPGWAVHEQDLVLFAGDRS